MEANENTIVKGVELPFFYGFYNSPLDDSEWAIKNEIENYHEQGKDYEWDDFDFDYENYQIEVCKAFVNVWKENYLPEWVEDIEFEEVWHPRYYNFQTDKCYVTITLTNDWKDKMARFINEHHEWLEKRIKEDWTSRSGFISYMENDYDAFYHELMSLEPRYLSVAIGYYALIQKNEIDDMYDLACETMEEFNRHHSSNEYVLHPNE